MDLSNLGYDGSGLHENMQMSKLGEVEMYLRVWKVHIPYYKSFTKEKKTHKKIDCNCHFSNFFLLCKKVSECYFAELISPEP